MVILTASVMKMRAKVITEGVTGTKTIKIAYIIRYKRRTKRRGSVMRKRPPGLTLRDLLKATGRISVSSWALETPRT